MTLGLPDHLVGTSVGRALAQATHWFGLTCLAGALISVAVLGISHPSVQIGVSLLGILVMAILLLLLSRHRTVLLSVAYLLVGTIVTYVVSVTLLGLPELFHSSDVFLVSMPKMALLMVGGVGTGALVGVLWGTAGFILAEAVTVFAALETGVPYHPDAFTVSTYLFLVGVMLVSGFGRRRHRPVQLAMHRALQEDQSRLLRHELDVRAVALSQDTTLNQLVALVHAHPGPLTPHLAAGIRETVDTLHGTSWLTDSDERLSGPDGWLDSAVYSAIERCRDRGLVVEVTGERAALGRLDAVADRELGLAVQQCLINVILHAGIVSAEVVIDSTDHDLSVMVMDAGRGFTESETGADRLGLRQAVRRRIERLGGSVTIMTRPGAGTSVLLTVPAAPGDAVERPGTGAASGPASGPVGDAAGDTAGDAAGDAADDAADDAAGDTASDAGIGWPR